MKECEAQCESIKRGISKVVPKALLNLVNHKDLETWICGKNFVDIDLLKRHTKYKGNREHSELNEDDQIIKWFWEVLRNDMKQEDLMKLIKFCWGQERLPANDEEFERRQIRFMIKPQVGYRRHGDQALPRADTCFFNLELPFYSSKEILKQKLMLAISFDCDSLNAETDQMRDNGDQRHMNDYDDEQYGGGGGGGSEGEEVEMEQEEEEE